MHQNKILIYTLFPNIHFFLHFFLSKISCSTLSISVERKAHSTEHYLIYNNNSSETIELQVILMWFRRVFNRLQ